MSNLQPIRNELAVRDALPISLPTLKDLPAGGSLRYVEAEEKGKAGVKASAKDAPVLKGLKDLQELQKQTIAVLESVQSSLEDIQQVLRSPEATRGLEKQKNAATLLAKGFAKEAVQQASDAAQLLPANPEAQLLLALSLAADHDLEHALACTRKGLALVDRRTHPLAIEAGLLHALASLGCIGEAQDRWAGIIDTLPLPVLLEQLPRIAACYPRVGKADATGLDTVLATRITRGRLATEEVFAAADGARTFVDTKPTETPAGAFLAGIDAAHEAGLRLTHRAILVLVAQRLNACRDSLTVLKFVTEMVLPLGNRNLRSASRLGRACVKRLLRFHADAETLHKAMMKLHLAGCSAATKQLAMLLGHWKQVGRRNARQRRVAVASVMLILLGTGVLAWVLFGMDAINGKTVNVRTAWGMMNAIYVGPGVIGMGLVLGLWRLLGRTVEVRLPNGRGSLAKEELRFLKRMGALPRVGRE